MRVHWTQTAEDHLDAIYAFISQNSSEYALRTIDRLTARSQQIGEFPLSGRMVQEYGMHEIREVFESSYRIIYLINPEQIDVLAVIHGARDILRREKIGN